MRKMLLFMVLVCLISVFSRPFVFAEPELKSELLESVVDDIEKSGSGIDFSEVIDDVENQKVFDFWSIVSNIAKSLFSELSENIKVLIRLVAVALLTGILCNLRLGDEKGGTAEICFFACYSIVSVMVINTFSEVMDFCNTAIDSMRIFMQSLFPAFSMLISCGGAINVAAMSPMLFSSMQIITFIAQNVFVPMIFVITVLCVVNNLSEKFAISRLIEILRQLQKWGLGLLMTVFVGILGIQGISTAFLDGVAGKTIKYALCNFVPIVGSVLADSAAAVIYSSGVVRNTLGIAGIATFCIMSFAPLVKISAIAIFLKIASGVCEPVTDKRIVTLFWETSKSLTQIFGLITVIGITFVISVAVLCMISGAPVG